MKVVVFSDAAQAGRALAADIADGIAEARASGRRYLLGCPGGRSPFATYQALSEEIQRRDADLRHLVLVMMDEYVLPSAGGYVAVPVNSHFSLRRFAEELLLRPLNAAASPGKGVSEDHLWIPDPAAAEEYDRRIEAAGEVDLFVLATGSSDGHVGFNPPGSSEDTRTRIVALADTTRRDNLATFPGFASLEEVPRHGVSVGISTISSLSARAVLVANGADKQRAVARLAAAQTYEPDWPATVLAKCKKAALYADASAAALLPDTARFAPPIPS